MYILEVKMLPQGFITPDIAAVACDLCGLNPPTHYCEAPEAIRFMQYVLMCETCLHELTATVAPHNYLSPN